MWNDFINYNLKRTNLLKDFTKFYFQAGDPLLPYFLSKWEKCKCILESVLYVKQLYYSGLEGVNISVSEDTLAIYKDYKYNWWEDKDILKCLRELFPDMFRANYEVRNLERDIPNFSPLSILEFWKITKAKYYLGADLDEDLKGMIPYVKDQNLIEKYMEDIQMYFKFRYDHYDLNLLCEYCSIPFGFHESRAYVYKKTGILDFEYPREYYKYNVKSIVDKYLTKENRYGTRVINIRGTNGSGKTTMVNQIYEDSASKGFAKECAFELVDGKGKSHTRYYDVLEDKRMILLGGYNSPFGTKGTDRIGDASEIMHGILYLVSNYPGWTIIMESATVSTSFWGYALLFLMLKQRGVDILIVSLLMKNWDFPVNNVRNRTVRKEGAKEPNYKEIVDKREILYKNHFRFSSLLGRDSCAIMYPDTVAREQMSSELYRIIGKL
jgi:hypothetical protein